MSPRLKEEDWRPVGITDLEPAADEAVRSTINMLVVAGPGAGKTELLAQRANFLLETGGCPAPKRVLAISFKRDAAKNLKNRVKERCGERADRFDSLTLDAFAKGIVDRFLPAIPGDWRPKAAYQIRLRPPSVRDAEDWMMRAPLPGDVERPVIQRWGDEGIRKNFDAVMHGFKLPYDDHRIDRVAQAWGLRWWRDQLEAKEEDPSLAFPMLNRLAAYLLRCNPKVLKALRQTYSHVFMDEFQDTTASQWDLVESSFQGSASVITAVGDTKQRIMLWAGAMTTAFEAFQNLFAPERKELMRNYRSLPELVRIQYVIAQAVETGVVESECACTKEGESVCSIIEFLDPEQEAKYLADFIYNEIATGQKLPRDFCIIVRQLTGQMIELLKKELANKNIRLRDESVLQDLMTEPLAEIVLSIINLAVQKRGAKAWSYLIDELSLLTGLNQETDYAELERNATTHITTIRAMLARGDDFADIPRKVISIVGKDSYRSTYKQYSQGDYLGKVTDDLGAALRTSMNEVEDPKLVVNDLMGIDIIPAMTIHKSKGLEFDTVIFLGLEDGQWWNFRKQPEEEKRAFFVAFSRAIRRVFFTFSDERDTRWGRRLQMKKNVDTLHNILYESGVITIDKRGW